MYLRTFFNVEIDQSSREVFGRATASSRCCKRSSTLVECQIYLLDWNATKVFEAPIPKFGASFGCFPWNFRSYTTVDGSEIPNNHLGCFFRPCEWDSRSLPTSTGEFAGFSVCYQQLGDPFQPSKMIAATQDPTPRLWHCASAWTRSLRAPWSEKKMGGIR